MKYFSPFELKQISRLMRVQKVDNIQLNNQLFAASIAIIITSIKVIKY